MKRVYKVNDVKNATGSVMSGLGNLQSKLSTADANALSQMIDISNQHAEAISQDELAVVEAGVGAKPMSSHSSGSSWS